MPNVVVREQVAETIRTIARKHNVAYTPTGNDRLAHHITRLAGDAVELDEPARLLLALERGRYISRPEALRLRAAYIRAKFE